MVMYTERVQDILKMATPRFLDSILNYSLTKMTDVPGRSRATPPH